jgi:hypothetical protein
MLAISSGGDGADLSDAGRRFLDDRGALDAQIGCVSPILRIRATERAG